MPSETIVDHKEPSSNTAAADENTVVHTDVHTAESQHNESEANQNAAGDGATNAESKSDPSINQDDLDLGYSVRLDAFSGPLDLLLYLVRRAEVDVSEIKISEIADQFIETLRLWDDMDLDVAGDFILMAASLLEIKARLVVPPDEEIEEEEEDLFDPRAELIHQLLQFRKFKEATQVLQVLEDDNLLAHHRRQAEQIPEAAEEADYNLENADAYQLFFLWDNILVSIAGKRPRTVVYDDVPIEFRVKQVVATMERALEGQLNWLFGTVETRIQRIGVFVAVLQCIRQSFLEAIQHEQYGSVYLRYRDEQERTAEPELPPSVDEPGKSKRRRRRRQLVTYRSPVVEQEQDGEGADDQEELDLLAAEEELVIETDEQRFLRELNSETAVDDLLAIGKDLEASMLSHLYAQGVMEDVLAEATDERALAEDKDADFDDEYDDDDEIDDEDETDAEEEELEPAEDESGQVEVVDDLAATDSGDDSLAESVVDASDEDEDEDEDDDDFDDDEFEEDEDSEDDDEDSEGEIEEEDTESN